MILACDVTPGVRPVGRVGEHIYTITLCVCVCVPMQESSSLVDSHLGRTYCRVERTTKEPASRVLRTHTPHSHRVIVYICSPTNSMTTCRPASVLLLIYGKMEQMGISSNLIRGI